MRKTYGRLLTGNGEFRTGDWYEAEEVDAMRKDLVAFIRMYTYPVVEWKANDLIASTEEEGR